MNTKPFSRRVPHFSILIATLLGVAIASQAAPPIPPLPKGIAELKFNEFFATPVGPAGLVLSAKLKALHGARVRILGHMVQQEHAPEGAFLLTPIPVQLHDHDSSDDLPAACVRVIVPPGIEVSHTPQLLLLTGALSVGNREESDGRISMVRLVLDKTSFRKKPARRATGIRGGAQDLMQ